MGADNLDMAFAPARVVNANGTSPFVILCDHASNFVPPQFGTLGLPESDLDRHIAWDPGAAPVAREIANILDAPLVESCVSRLVIDCNRPLDAPDLIWSVSETTTIPDNQNLTSEQRAERVAVAYTPYHDAIERLVTERLERGVETALVAVHSFTPVYKGVARPWHIGILHDGDTRLAAPLLEQLSGETDIIVGENEPYSPADRVYFTLEHHGRSRDLACVMIEIRNDAIADRSSQDKWARLLASILAGNIEK